MTPGDGAGGGSRPAPPLRDVDRLLWWALLALDLALLARGAWAWGLHVHARVVEPTAILWLEPMFLRGALQAMQGLPLYGPPGPEYASAMYTPLVDLVNGRLLALFGVGYPPLRILAVAVFAGLLGVVARWIQRETGSLGWALVGAGLLLPVSGQVRHWFSAVNVDGPFLLAGLAGAYLLRFGPDSRRRIAAAGLLFAISFLCKPQGFVLAVAGFAFVVLRERRHAWVFAASCAGLAGGVSLLYLLASGGWYWTSIVTVPLACPTRPEVGFLGSLLRVSWLGSASLFAALPLLASLALRGTQRREATLLLLLCVAALGIAWPSFRKEGGDVNSLYPVALVGLLCFAVLPRIAAARSGRAALQLGLVQLGIAAAVLGGGFGRDLHALRVIRQAPGHAEGRARLHDETRRFELRLAQELSGAAHPFVGARPRLQVKLGLPLNTHQTPLYNLTVRARLVRLDEVFGDALARGAWDRLVLWELPGDPLLEQARQRYRRVKQLGPDPLLGRLTVGVWEPRR